MKRSAFGLICACLLSLPQPSLADTIIYGANAYGRADMIEINLTQGTSQQVGDILFDTQAIDQDPESGFVYYFEWASSGNELAYWDPITSTNTRVRTYASTPWGLAKRAAFDTFGELYLMDDGGRLYTVDTATGDELYVGQVQGIQTGSSSSGDMAFSPDGTLYVVISENLYRVDMDTLPLVATLLYSNLIPGGGWKVWTGLAFCDGSLYASDVDMFSRISAIYRINPDTGAVNLLFSTQTMLNDLSSCPANIDNPPAVSIMQPEDGAVVAGTITISAEVTQGDNPIDRVDFYVDDNPVGTDSDAAYEIDWDTTTAAEGGHIIRVTVVDTTGLSSSASVNVSIDNVNAPPEITSVPGTFATVGLPYTYDVEAVDPDPGDILTYSLLSPPAGMTIDPQTGLIEWTPVSEDVGENLVQVAVEDGESGIDTQDFTISVSETPTEIEVFFDSFEDGLDNWGQDAQNDWFRSTQRASDGTYAAEVDGLANNAQLISVPIDLQGRMNALVTFSWYIESGLDSGEYLACDVSTDGGSTWVERARIRGNVNPENQWHAVSTAVNLSAGGDLTLRFRGSMSLYNEDANVDAVTVTAW